MGETTLVLIAMVGGPMEGRVVEGDRSEKDLWFRVPGSYTQRALYRVEHPAKEVMEAIYVKTV